MSDYKPRITIYHDLLAEKIYAAADQHRQRLIDIESKIKQHLITHREEAQKGNQYFLSRRDLNLTLPYLSEIILNNEEKDFIQKSKRQIRLENSKNLVKWIFWLAVVAVLAVLFGFNQRNSKNEINKQKKEIEKQQMADSIKAHFNNLTADAYEIAKTDRTLAFRLIENINGDSLCPLVTTKLYRSLINESSLFPFYNQSLQPFNKPEHILSMDATTVDHNTRVIAIARNRNKSLISFNASIDSSICNISFHHSEPVTVVQFIGNGKYIITASKDGKVTIWNYKNNKRRVFFKDFATPISSLSVGGNYIYMAGKKGMRLFEFNNKNERLFPLSIDPLFEEEKEIKNLTTSSDGKQVALERDSTIRIYNYEDYNYRYFKKENGISCMKMSPNGENLLVGYNSGNIQLISLKSFKVKTSYSHDNRINSLHFFENGEKFISSSTDKTAKVWLLDGTVIHELKGHSDAVYHAYYDENELAITSGEDGKIKTWDLSSIANHYPFSGDGVKGVAFKNRDTIVIGGFAKVKKGVKTENEILLFNTNEPESYEKAKRIPIGQPHLNALSVSKNGNYIAASLSNFATIIVDNSNKIFANSGNASTGNSLSLDISDNNQIVAGGSGSKGHNLAVKAIDYMDFKKPIKITYPSSRLQDWTKGVTYQKEIKEVNGETKEDLKKKTLKNVGHKFKIPHTIVSVAISPSGDSLVIGTEDAYVLLQDKNKPEKLDTLNIDHTDKIRAIKFSKYGDKLLTGSWDNSAILFDIKDRKMLYQFKGHTSDVNAVDFSPDESLILTASSDNTVKIWEANTGRESYSLIRHPKSIYDACFSPDGQSILAGGRDNYVSLWPLLEDENKMHEHYVSWKAKKFTEEEKKRLINSLISK